MLLRYSINFQLTRGIHLPNPDMGECVPGSRYRQKNAGRIKTLAQEQQACAPLPYFPFLFARSMCTESVHECDNSKQKNPFLMQFSYKHMQTLLRKKEKMRGTHGFIKKAIEKQERKRRKKVSNSLYKPRPYYKVMRKKEWEGSRNDSCTHFIAKLLSLFLENSTFFVLFFGSLNHLLS